MRPFAIDLSKYQGPLVWEAIAAHPDTVFFVGIRCTVSWGYKDSLFDYNWNEAKRVGQLRQASGGAPLLRTAYHVPFPGESASRQVENFFRSIGPDLGELPPTLDIERNDGQSNATIIANTTAHYNAFRNLTGRVPIIYSRKTFVDYYMRGASWLNEPWWWLALYLSSGLEHPGPALAPIGVDQSRVLIHQTSGNGKAIGGQGGNSMDYNRLTVEPEEFYRLLGVTVEQPGTELTARVDSLEDLTASLESRISKLEASNDQS